MRQHENVTARARDSAVFGRSERQRHLVDGNDARRCNAGYIHGLDRVFSKREFGELLVEVRNRRQLLALGRTEPKARGARFDLAAMPDRRLTYRRTSQIAA